MEVVITIALLIVPVISIVALVLVIRNASRVKALKQLVLDLSKIVQDKQNSDPVEKAVNKFRIGEM